LFFVEDQVALFYGLCDLFLVFIGGVFWDCLEIVVCWECVYLVVVILFVYDNQGFSFVCLCDHCIVFLDLVLDVLC